MTCPLMQVGVVLGVLVRWIGERARLCHRRGLGQKALRALARLTDEAAAV